MFLLYKSILRQSSLPGLKNIFRRNNPINLIPHLPLFDILSESNDFTGDIAFGDTGLFDHETGEMLDCFVADGVECYAVDFKEDLSCSGRGDRDRHGVEDFGWVTIQNCQIWKRRQGGMRLVG